MKNTESKKNNEPTQIKGLVRRAFDNRVIKDYSPVENPRLRFSGFLEGFSDGDILHGKKQRNLLDGPDEEILSFDEWNPLHTAYVESPDMYPYLLFESAKTVFTYMDRPLPDELARILVKKDYYHELEHAAGVKGIAGLRVRYGVSFSQNSSGTAVSYQPNIQLVGKISRGQFRQALNGTNWKSRGDEEALKN